MCGVCRGAGFLESPVGEQKAGRRSTSFYRQVSAEKRADRLVINERQR
jgi:hypothetical protein